MNPGPFEKALQAVIKNCKGSDVAAEAQKTMDLMKNASSKNDAIEGTSTYIYAASEPHFFLYIHKKTTGNISPLKTKVSNFNSSSFSSKGLVTSTNFLNGQHQILMVKAFKNKTEAMDYFTAFQVNEGPLKAFNSGDNFFVITGKNYAALLFEKDDVDYKVFFEKNYLD